MFVTKRLIACGICSVFILHGCKTEENSMVGGTHAATGEQPGGAQSTKRQNQRERSAAGGAGGHPTAGSKGLLCVLFKIKKSSGKVFLNKLDIVSRTFMAFPYYGFCPTYSNNLILILLKCFCD